MLENQKASTSCKIKNKTKHYKSQDITISLGQLPIGIIINESGKIYDLSSTKKGGVILTSRS